MPTKKTVSSTEIITTNHKLISSPKLCQIQELERKEYISKIEIVEEKTAILSRLLEGLRMIPFIAWVWSKVGDWIK